VTFLENTAAYRRELRREKYGDESDEKMRAILQDISPLTNAHKIKSPLFVVQGANDPRVPVTEAVQIFEKAKAQGYEIL
jgi:dipeptidyl aminopeptidase/acylaminoacyl peptidase